MRGLRSDQGGTRKRKLQLLPLHFVSASRRAAKAGAFAYVTLALFGLPVHSTLAQIKIGAVTCLTGELSTFGVSSRQGAKLAQEDVNAAGGVLGQPIELIVEDN
jgi:ABC-type branched-subunit amino acid transport system substrate-binding protein